MRYAFAIAGLAVAAQAGNTYTLTATEEVTITSCAPTHTNCPYKSQSNEWENWGKPADPTTKVSSGTWGTWDPSKPTTTSKPNGGDWNNWNGNNNGDGKKTTTSWGSWDPSKPSTSAKPNGDDWNNWNGNNNGNNNAGDWNNWNGNNNGDGKKTTYSKPATATGDNGDWNNWGYGNDGKKTTSSKPAGATGANGDWNNWGAGSDGKSTKPAGATGANGDWNNWGANGDGKTSAKPATATGVNGEWNNWGGASGSATNTAACPSYTATAPPAWFSQLPSSVLSSLAAQWTGAPPKDWCYYSYSASSMATKTPDAASTGNGEWNNWGAAATGTPVKGSATGSGPVAKYTGAANVNAASFVLGGAAAIAAIVLV